MLCASVSCWARLFLQQLETQILWIIRETDDRWFPASREISLAVRWLWGLSSWLSNSDSTVSTFSSICTLRLPHARTPVDCSELHQQPVDAVLRPTFVQKLCYKLPGVVTFTFIQIFDQNFESFTEQRQSCGCRVCLIKWQNSRYFWCPVRRRKVDKKQTCMKTETCKLYSIETFEYFYQISSKLIVIISSYRLPFQIWVVFETQRIKRYNRGDRQYGQFS